MSLAPTPEARDRLRRQLGLIPAPAKPGEMLTPEQERRLAELAAEMPHATHAEIARRFAAESGRRIALNTVQARRESRPVGACLRPLSPGEAATLTAIVRAAGPGLVRADVAIVFEARTGRPVSSTTVTAYATRIYGPRRLRGVFQAPPARYASAADWPAWSDEVRFTIAGPAARGGGR